MKCPFCNVGIKLDIKEQFAYPDNDYSTTNLGKELLHGICPECKNFIVLLRIGKYRWVDDKGEVEVNESNQEIVIYPTVYSRSFESEIPDIYKDVFNEANAVLLPSPKASAALSRRLLQHILRDEYHIKKENLSKEIDEFINIPNIPSEIAGEIDAIRNIGNFAAHPTKYKNTGEIADVENGEAEWLLDVLEDLFDFTFIRPRRAQLKKETLNKKLADLEKPAMK
jgi:hypothetical protein